MGSTSLINWKRFWFVIILLIAVIIVSIGAEVALFQTYYSLCVFGGLIIIWSLLYYLKVRVYQILVLFSIGGLAFIHAFLVFEPEQLLPLYGLAIHLVVFLILVPLFVPPILKTYELELNARRLFNMAADFNREESNGYTDRPYFAGQVEFTEEEIIGFARYLHGKRIAMSEMLPDRIIVSFSMKTSPVSKPNLNDISYLTFDMLGTVMVYISRRDYKKYKNAQSFDQLCDSMGKLFKRFLDYYQNGNEERFMAVFLSVKK
jgi:hypothetical protein